MEGDIKSYIKKSRAGGQSDTQIREGLLNAGWRLDDIDTAFNEPGAIERDMPSQPKADSRLWCALVVVLLIIGGWLWYRSFSSGSPTGYSQEKATTPPPSAAEPSGAQAVSPAVAIGPVRCGAWSGDITGFSGPATAADLVVWKCMNEAIFASCQAAGGSFTDTTGGPYTFSVHPDGGACAMTLRSQNGSGSVCMYQMSQLTAIKSLIDAHTELSDAERAQRAFEAFTVTSAFATQPGWTCTPKEPSIGCPVCTTLK